MVEETKKIDEKETKKEEIVETAKTEKTEEKAKEETKKEKKKEQPKIVKEEAIAHGQDLGISTKHSVAICDYIRGKSIDWAMKELDQVSKLRKAIPMKGELPHRKGDMERGRYPVKASLVFIKLLKGLKANASVNGIEDPYIAVAKPDVASQPHRRFGSRRFKRTNVLLTAKSLSKKKETKNKKTEEKK